MPWNATKKGWEDWATERLNAGLPYNTANTKIVNGRVQGQGTALIDDWTDIGILAGGLGGAFAGPALAAGAAGGSGLAATPGVTAGIPAGSAIGSTVALPGAGISAAPLAPLTRNAAAPLANIGKEAGTKMADGGWFGKLFKQFDPTMLALGGLSMLGGGSDDNLNSFKGTEADPVQRVSQLYKLIENLGSAIESRPFRSTAYVPRGPAPVSIPGIPFQIGGGMGVDPAIWQGVLTEPSPFQSPFQEPKPRQRTQQPRNPGVRRRGGR